LRRIIRPVAYLPQASITLAMDGDTADRVGHSGESADFFVVATSSWIAACGAGERRWDWRVPREPSVWPTIRRC